MLTPEPAPPEGTRRAGSTSSRARWNAGVLALVLVWAAVQWNWGRPAEIAADWHAWRQCDTQAIARNLLEPGASLFWPRIDWGGDGPGYVESELQVYPAAIAVLMARVGDAEWPGQFLSLAAFAAAGLVLFAALRNRYGEVAALAGTAALLASRGVVFLSTSVQPESFSFLAYVVAWTTFEAYSRSGNQKTLAGSAAATAVSALIKPTALHLGVSQFFLLLASRRRLLRRAGPWLAWSGVLLVVAAYYLHARSLYKEYGNTFGILSGGDSKLPSLQHLVAPWIYRELATNSIFWGLGLLGLAAGIYLLVRRKLDAREWSLAVGNVLLLLTAMRYTSHESMGSHYHVYTTLLAALLVAHATHQVGIDLKRRTGFRGAAIGAVFVLIGLSYSVELRERRVRAGSGDNPVFRTGESLAKFAEPGDLVVVRSGSSARSDYWDTENNYQDPRIFYMARVSGWVVPPEVAGSDALEDMTRWGARFYAEPGAVRDDPDLYRWLEQEATLKADSASGRIYELRSP